MKKFMNKQQASLDSSAETLNRFVTAYEKKAAPTCTCTPCACYHSTCCYNWGIEIGGEKLYGWVCQNIIWRDATAVCTISGTTTTTTCCGYHSGYTHVRVVHGLSKNYLAQQIQSSAQSNEQQQERHVCQELGCDKEAIYGYSGLKLSCHDHCAEDMEFIRPL